MLYMGTSWKFSTEACLHGTLLKIRHLEWCVDPHRSWDVSQISSAQHPAMIDLGSLVLLNPTLLGECHWPIMKDEGKKPNQNKQKNKIMHHVCDGISVISKNHMVASSTHRQQQANHISF